MTQQKQWLMPLQEFHWLGQTDTQNNPLYHNSKLNCTVSSKTIKISERDNKTALAVAQWRYLIEHPIVKLYHGHLIKESRNAYYVNTLVDHFQQTLRQLYQIPLSQALYILKTAICAIEKLVTKFGFFHLTSNMIGITRNKECKVWIHEDLTQFVKLGDAVSQQAMLDKLFVMVQQHTEIDQISREFFTKATKQCTSFIKSQNFINYFTFQEDIIVPHLFIEDRRKTFDPYTMRRLSQGNTQANSFISNKNSTVNLGSNNILVSIFNKSPLNVKAERTSQLFFKKSDIKNSFIKPGSRTPTQISFTYQSSNGNKINGSDIYRSPFSNTSILRQQGKHAILNSAENKPNCLNTYRSQPYLGMIAKNDIKDSVISEGNKSLANFKKRSFDDKKMSIISTLSLKINSQPNLFSPHYSQRIKNIDYEVQENSDTVKRLFNEQFSKNQWKRTVSQLFSSDKNLKESMSYGQEEKAYLKDIDLKKLNKFGRFIATSVLQRDQDQQSQHIGQFRAFAV